MDDNKQHIVDELAALMQLERIEVDLFRGQQTHEHWSRVFGGQVIGQALMAACQTVDSRKPHSLHAYFLRAGDPALPIVHQVSRDRDGRSFSSRRVVAIQHGAPILNLAASFQVEEAGLSHQRTMPRAPPPETLEDDRGIALRHEAKSLPERRHTLARSRPIEFRPLDPEHRLGAARISITNVSGSAPSLPCPLTKFSAVSCSPTRRT